MNKKMIVGTLAVAAVVLAAVTWNRAAAHTDDGSLQLSGNVDVRTVDLSWRVAGRLKSLRVDEGAKVAAGDVLGELDDEPYRIALADAQARLAAVQARQSLMRSGLRPEDVAQAQTSADAREAALLNAEKVLARQQSLVESGAGARRALDDARSQRDQDAAQLEGARQKLAATQSGFRKEERAEADANVARAVAQRDQAQLELADTVLRAPGAGTILTRVSEPGTVLAAGSAGFTLSIGGAVWIRAYADEPALGRVVPGARVTVRTDASPRVYAGVIGFVSPNAEFTPKNVETRDLRTGLVYRLRIIVQDPDDALRQGMPVTVTLAAA